ncbi:MAG: class I SAM-dependent methyltransferase [Nitrospirae bacterium]|nr:class I SAM-dependent methyltransferase [Nitrospirota bacterium]
MDSTSIEAIANPEKVYDGLATVYDHWIEEVPALKIFYNIFHRTIEQNRGKFYGTVLDIGCGTGILTRRIASMSGVKRVIGIDISPASVGQASGKEIPGCNFYVASATQIPLKDRSVDCVVAYGDTLSHIHKEYSYAVSETARVCRPGAYIFFDIDNKWNMSLFYEWEELRAAVSASLSEGHVRIWSFVDSRGKYNTMRFKTFTPHEIRMLLAAHGLKIVSFEGIIILPNILPQNIHYSPSSGGILGNIVTALGKFDSLVSSLPGLRGLGIGASIIAKRI